MDLRRLLLTFVGLALFVLILFGILAHRIARDSADQQQINMLKLMLQQQADQLNRWTDQGLGIKTLINTKQPAKHAVNVLLVDGQGGIIATDIQSNTVSHFLADKIFRFNNDQQIGEISTKDTDFIWARQSIPQRNLQLILLLDKNITSKSPYLNLTARLAVTGFIVIWIAVWGALILFSNVTRKTNKLEADRRRSDEQVRLLLNSTAEAIYGVDAQGNCTFCNPAALHVLGYESDADLLGKNLHQLIHHTKADGSPHPIGECIIGKVISRGEGVHVHSDVFWRADGSSFPVEYRGHPIRWQDEIVGAVVTFLDISEKLQAEQERQKLSQVIEQASDAVYITDSDGFISYVNSAFESITGYRKEEIIGRHFELLSASYHKNQREDTLWHKVKSGEVFSGVRLKKRKDNEEFYVQETVAPLKDSFGSIAHVVFTCKDISVQLEQEAKIQSVIIDKQLAEQANREKSSFLANMSHELRTPLNAIIGYSEILQEEFKQEQQVQVWNDLNKIHAAGNHLLALINDVLDFSKIEAGKLELHFEDIEVESVLQEVVNIISPMTEQNNNQFVMRIDDNIGTIHTDVIRLRQCLFNLLSNASKFAQNKRVTFSVKKEQRHGEPWLRFVVEDQGIGIGEDKMAKLFKEFSQADDTTTRRFGGTGLGLTISRRLARMMGGDIEAQSQLGEGSTFTLSVPVCPQHQIINKAAQA
jgi:PAS domain S-box-containing protein